MNQTIRKLRSSVILAYSGIALALLIAGGCASYSIVPPNSHPAVTGDNVALHQNRPMKYEIPGIVTMPVTPDYHWDSNGHARQSQARRRHGDLCDRAIARLDCAILTRSWCERE